MATNVMRTMLVVMLAALVGGLWAMSRPSQAPSVGANPVWSVAKLPNEGAAATRMTQYYRPIDVDMTPQAPSYALPLDLNRIINAQWTKAMLTGVDADTADEFQSMLQRNGFAVLAQNRYDDVAKFYESCKRKELPIFITSDSLLHLYHIQFAETLRSIEEREFAGDVALICQALQDEAVRLHSRSKGELKQAAALLAGYSAVAASLLDDIGMEDEARAALAELESIMTEIGGRKKIRTLFATTYKDLLNELATPEMPAEVLTHSAKHLRLRLIAYLDEQEQYRPHTAPAFVADNVRRELALIERHAGFSGSPLFTYREDYSQYVPRGHYTRSRTLQQYFKAMMWCGRMTFLIRGKTDDGDGLISEEQARVQTLAACVLAGLMETELADGRRLADVWDRLYGVTAYYVGLADDLTPYEYRQVMRDTIGERVSARDLLNAKNFFKVRKELALLRKPQIYGDTGDYEAPPVEIASEADLAKALSLTQGQRLMGQRYIPDSYMMGKLVYPTVGTFTGGESAFTTFSGMRVFPRGLDVMAVLGSDRAAAWLDKLGDSAYDEYDETLATLQATFARVDQRDWNRNMYWSWLYALKGLLAETGPGYPTFMQTDAWRDKQLSAALASWAQLRHDTILYAKQSYTLRATALPLPPKMVEGYVEPVPAFYARLLSLTRMTLTGLGDMAVLDETAEKRLRSLEKIIARLLDISQRELRNETLDSDDYDFIRNFGDELKTAVAELQEGMETTLVADVHTDTNSSQVLEEATGYLHPMIVVYPMPDGGLVAGCGPVLSHYEFKHPMDDRLIDEAWRQMLKTGKTAGLPEWTQTFTVTAR